MQRFASQMILALGRSGLSFTLLLGEVHGEPLWLRGVRYEVILSAHLAARLPRSVAAMARVAWLQFILPFRMKRLGARLLLSLASELPPFPFMPQIGVAHDLTDFKAFAERRGAGIWVKNAMWKGGLQKAISIIAISEATRDDLVRTFALDAERINVVHEGFDKRLFHPEKATKAVAARPFLLFAGTLDPHKNVALLIKLLAELRADGVPVSLKLVGRQDPRLVAALRSQFPPGLQDDIEFIGFVSDEALAVLMRDCAAFVFPSRNEGFGLAPVEAMACGAPVVAASAGSLPEVIAGGGVLLDPDDVRAWKDEIRRVLEDPGHARALSRRALERSAAFSWDKAAREYRAIIEKALAGERVGATAAVVPDAAG